MIGSGPMLIVMLGMAIILLLIVFVWIGTRGLNPGSRWVARIGLTALVLAPLAAAVFMNPVEKSGETASAPRLPSQPRAQRAPTPQTEVPGTGQDDGATPSADLPRTRGLARSAPSDDEKWHIVPVFYGTDRSDDPTSQKTKGYSAERGKRLDLGRALISVPKVHQVPDIERPWVYKIPFTNVVVYREEEDPNKHFVVRTVEVMSQDVFLQALKDRLASSRLFKDHALIFVHGFNTSFQDALFRTAQISYDLGFDGAPLVYSWPSKGEVTSYSYDRESAGQAQPYLRAFLQAIAAQSGAKRVSIIAHSMGNQLLLPVLRDLRDALPEGLKLGQIVLAAPDVDRDAFEFLAGEIRGVSKGVTLYANANDRALEASRQFWGGVPRAGDVPEGGPLIIAGIDTIDVTSTSSNIFSLNHSGYAKNKALLNDIQLILQTGERPPEKRIPILERVSTDRGIYWRYPASR